MLARSAFAPRKKNAPRPAWKVAEAFKQWLRGRPCACAGRNPDCGGPVQAAHAGEMGDTGTGTKAADRLCIPLTANCHRLQHDKGWPWFEANMLRMTRRQATDAYWRAWPGRAKWEADRG